MQIHIICTILIIIIILLVLENIRETHRFIIREYSYESQKLCKRKNPRKVMILSDLHNKVYGKNNQKLLDSISEINPDVILIAGDMLVGHTRHPFDHTADFLCQLPKISRVYYANGNHEQRMKENPEIYGDRYIRYKDRLVNSGIIMLENKSYVRDWDSDLACVYGIEIPMEYYQKFRSDKMKKEEVEHLIGKANIDTYNILIAHNPVHYRAYQEWGADLIVSGHLHGGIVRLPLIGGVITPQVELFPRYSGGMYRIEDTTFVVSRGLGNHTINIRLFNPAEIVVLNIDGTK